MRSPTRDEADDTGLSGPQAEDSLPATSLSRSAKFLLLLRALSADGSAPLQMDYSPDDTDFNG